MDYLDPHNGYYDGYPFGFVVGMQAVQSGKPAHNLPARSPSEEGVPAPFVDPKYVQQWSDAFTDGWKYGFLNAFENGELGRYFDTEPYDIGYASGYPYGFERGKVLTSVKPTAIAPAGAGRTPPPGWSDQTQLAWSNGFGDGWLDGWDAGRAEAESSAWPEPPDAVKPWPFVPVQVRPPLYEVIPLRPFQPDESGEPRSGTEDSEQKTETSYTPWIIGGLLAAFGIGGGLWYMNNRRKANPIDQRDYKFYVVVGNKIESGWEYREDAQDQIKENLPPVGAKILTRKTLVSRGIDPNDDANWGDPRRREYRFTVQSSHRLSEDVKDELRGFQGLQGAITITHVDPGTDSVSFDVLGDSAETIDMVMERLFNGASDELLDSFQIDWLRDTELEQF